MDSDNISINQFLCQPARSVPLDGRIHALLGYGHMARSGAPSKHAKQGEAATLNSAIDANSVEVGHQIVLSVAGNNIVAP